MVIGLRPRTPVGQLLLGCTAQQVLLDAPCDVLAIRSDQPIRRAQRQNAGVATSSGRTRAGTFAPGAAPLAAPRIGPATDITIRDASIRLGQLLKLAGLVEDGGHARAVLDGGGVRVDGAVETRRGRQIRPGDVVTAELGGEAVVLTVSLR